MHTTYLTALTDWLSTVNGDLVVCLTSCFAAATIPGDDNVPYVLTYRNLQYPLALQYFTDRVFVHEQSATDRRRVGDVVDAGRQERADGRV